MLIRVQWAGRDPANYEAVDSSSWATLPFKPDPRSRAPVPRERLDNAPGHFAAVKVQGIVFSSDHVAVETLDDDSGAVRVWGWDDNPTESPPGRREALNWLIFPYVKDRRVRRGWNTRQYRTVYAERPLAWELWTIGMPPIENHELREWPEFEAEHLPRLLPIARHGIWLADDHWQRHLAARDTLRERWDAELEV